MQSNASPNTAAAIQGETTASSSASLPDPPSTPPRQRQLSRDQRFQILNYRAIGHSYQQIAVETGFTRNQVRWTCSTERATPRKKGHPRHKLSDRDLDEVVRFISMNRDTRQMPIKEVIRRLQLGVHPTTLKRALTHHGYKI